MKPDPMHEVLLREDGYLLIPRDVAADHFPNDLLFATIRDGEMWLLPTRGPAGGGFILKQRNAAGDRAVLLREAVPPGTSPGQRPATWDAQVCALRLPLALPSTHPLPSWNPACNTASTKP
ncbi:MAG: hydrogenase maturation protease [Bacteroidota bacterium]